MSDRSTRALLLAAGLFGAIAVGCGAYASHGLGPVKGQRAVELWTMASHYQMVHALAIAAIVALRRAAVRGPLLPAGILFAVGCLLFPGALYLLGWFGPSALGMVAPVGGLSFIGGWLCLAAAGLVRHPG